MVKRRKVDRRMVIISLDAVGARDLAYLKTLPNFQKLRAQSGYCDHVESVYPSITYPAHTSIVTGKKPLHHGVVNNLQLQPGRKSPDWMWQKHFIHGKTLYEAAAEKGYVTASILWPVTGKSRIRYCVPEIFANHWWQSQVMVSATNGPVLYQIELLKKFGHLMDGIKQPQLDNFVYAAADYTIRKYDPQLFLIHLTDVDTNRHLYGLDAPQIKEALDRHDERLGGICRALAETGDMEKTTIVVLGDHCQMDTHTVLYPNYYLKKAGLIRATADGKIKDYDFIAQHCDGSCYIYAGKKMKKQMTIMSAEEKEAVMKHLRSCLQKIPHLHEIFSRKHAAALGADGDCICMLEAEPGYYFQNGMEKPQEEVGQMQGERMLATHGYLPALPEYETFFMMSGYGVSQGEIPKMYLWDEGPTLASVLGVDLPDTDGKIIEQLLK